VDSGVDEGPICAQESFTIQDCVSLAEVERRGLALEHRLYPATLAWVLSEQFEFERLGGAVGRGRVRPRAEGSVDVRPA
jgi:folate-dependent phosphoribosylglycinamide formyltransferase PurN